MKILLAGAAGQLGCELSLTKPPLAEIIGFDHRSLDIADPHAVDKAMADTAPDIVINAAAYTAVDRAEADREAAFATNATGAGNLAHAAAAQGAAIIHVSTDFVFDGLSPRPYLPEAPPHPQGVYGASKLAGEEEVRRKAGAASLVIRTSWVYSAHGGNFVRTMLKLMGERDEINVVADQVGTPTWAKGLAEAIWRAADTGLSGTHHWSDAGVASWYDLAVAIREEALALGLLETAAVIGPIGAADYPTPATRPSYSVLNCTAIRQALNFHPPHWRENLRRMLRELKGIS